MTWEESESEEQRKLFDAVLKDVVSAIHQIADQGQINDLQRDQNNRLGVSSGFDEAIHELTKEIAIDEFRHDPEVMEAFRIHIRQTTRKLLLPTFKKIAP